MESQIAKIRSIIVHTVDYNGVGVLRGHGRIPRTIDPSSSHPSLPCSRLLDVTQRSRLQERLLPQGPGSLRVYQIRFRFFIFLHYFKRLLQNLQYNKIHKSSKVKCAQWPKELVFRVGHSHVQLTGIDRHLHTRWVFKRYTLYCL